MTRRREDSGAGAEFDRAVALLDRAMCGADGRAAVDGKEAGSRGFGGRIGIHAGGWDAGVRRGAEQQPRLNPLDGVSKTSVPVGSMTPNRTTCVAHFSLSLQNE